MPLSAKQCILPDRAFKLLQIAANSTTTQAVLKDLHYYDMSLSDLSISGLFS